MRLLRIQEFSLSTSTEYSLPVAIYEAGLKEAAKALFESECATFISPPDISVSKPNELYGYSLLVPMFNWAASIVINALGVTIAFKQGRTADDLELMIKLQLSALKVLKPRPLKRSVIAFNAHAAFEVPSDYAEHMKRFVSLGNSIESGGTVLAVAVPELGGQLRYVSEKSLAYQHALFFAVNAVCTKDISAETFGTLGDRFVAIAETEGLALPKPSLRIK